MAWTDITRRQYVPPKGRYASDLSDAEWALLEPMLPPARRLGRPRAVDLREVLNALAFIARSCCQWRLLPKDFPPFTTVQYYFYQWRDCGLWRAMTHFVRAARAKLLTREKRSEMNGLTFHLYVRRTPSIPRRF